METENQKDLARVVENMFEKSDEGESMWKYASKFAAQYDILQIQALTKLTYVAETCSEDIKKRLLAFRNYYIELMNNRNTAMFMLRMNEMNSLKKYFTGIEGKVQIDK